MASIWHYFPKPNALALLGSKHRPIMASDRHGFSSTPPRISPSRPHCLWLWLDGSIIIGCSGHCKQFATNCLKTKYTGNPTTYLVSAWVVRRHFRRPFVIEVCSLPNIVWLTIAAAITTARCTHAVCLSLNGVHGFCLLSFQSFHDSCSFLFYI